LLGHEYEGHSDEEGMISFEQDVLLKLRRLNLVVVENSVLVQGLHGVDLAVRLLLHEEHLAE